MVRRVTKKTQRYPPPPEFTRVSFTPVPGGTVTWRMPMTFDQLGIKIAVTVQAEDAQSAWEQFRLQVYLALSRYEPTIKVELLDE